MRRPDKSLHYLSHRDELGAHLNTLGLTGHGVEVGTFHGAYASVLLRTWAGHLHCVDPWINQPETVYFDGANKTNMPAIWQEVQASIGQNPKCSLHRMMSLEGAGLFEDGFFDFVYLDGNHALPSVRADIAAWFPKVRKGGIFAGHDFFTRYDKDTNSDAQTAVMEFAEKANQWPHVTWCTSWFFVKQ